MLVCVLANWNEVILIWVLGIVASQSMKRLANLVGKVRHYCYLAQSWLLEYLSVQQEKQIISTGPKLNTALSRTSYQATNMRHFICISYKKSADDLHKLSRYLLRMVVVFFTGHAPVKKHVNFVGLFNGNLIFQDGY
jgi:hypothetical protein